MLNARDKMTIAFAILSTILLIIALVCSVVFAAFTANKTATTTLKFHSGIKVTLTGVTGNQWQYRTSNAENSEYGVSGIPLEYLELNSISATVANNDGSGTAVYMRVFVMLTTSNSKGTLPTPAGDNLTYTKCPDDLTGLTENEKDFVNANKLAQTSVAYATYSSTTTNTKIIINTMEIFSNTTQTEWNGPTLKAYFRIYASTNNNEWNESVTFGFN